MLTPVLMSPADLAYPISSETVADTFTANYVVRATASDGVNLITALDNSGTIQIHDGFSSAITSTFSLGGSVRGLTVVGGNLVASDALDDTITVYSGLSNTPLSSFAYLNGSGLTSAAGDLVASNNTSAVTVFSGTSSSVSKTITLASVPSSLAYDGVRLYAGLSGGIRVYDGLSSTVLDTLTGLSADGLCFLGGDLVSSVGGVSTTVFNRYEAG